MCVAVPGRVIAIGPDGALVQVGGRKRQASTLFIPDLCVGEYVLVSSGTVVERLSAEEAQARLDMFSMMLEVVNDDSEADA